MMRDEGTLDTEQANQVLFLADLDTPLGAKSATLSWLFRPLFPCP